MREGFNDRLSQSGRRWTGGLGLDSKLGQDSRRGWVEIARFGMPTILKFGEYPLFLFCFQTLFLPVGIDVVHYSTGGMRPATQNLRIPTAYINQLPFPISFLYSRPPP